MRPGEEVEIADGVRRGSGTFPSGWGTPPDGPFSEARARWVRDRVREHQATAGRRAVERRVRQLRARDRRQAQALLVQRHELMGRRLQLLARRAGP